VVRLSFEVEVHEWDENEWEVVYAHERVGRRWHLISDYHLALIEDFFDSEDGQVTIDQAAKDEILYQEELIAAAKEDAWEAQREWQREQYC